METSFQNVGLESVPTETDGDIDWFSAAALLWSDRRRVLRWFGIGLLLSTAATFLIPSRYKSTVSLMPPDPQSISSGSMLALMGGAAAPSLSAGQVSNVLGAKSATGSFVGVLESRTALDDLIERFDLRKVYGCKRYVDARKKLAQRTKVKEDLKTGVLSVTVADRDPRRAYTLAGAYAEELDKLVAQLSTSSARRERIFLEQRLQAVEQELEQASRDLSQFSSRNATLGVQSQGKTMVDAAARLEGELIAAQSEMRGLQAIYSDGNTRVRAAEARVTELEHQLQRMSGRDDTSDKTELRPGQLYPSLRRLPLLEVTYNNLYRRVKVQEAVYEILTKQYELAKVQEAREIPVVKVLDKPVVAERSSFPPRLLLIVLGSVVTGLLIALRLSAEHFWRKLGPNDPRKALARQIHEALRNGKRKALWLRIRTEQSR